MTDWPLAELLLAATIQSDSVERFDDERYTRLTVKSKARSTCPTTACRRGSASNRWRSDRRVCQFVRDR